MSQAKEVKEDVSTTESTSERQNQSKSVALNLGGMEVEIPLQTMQRQKQRSSKHLKDIAHEIGVDPFEFLLHVVNNNWQALGYESATVTQIAKDGSAFEVDRIQLSDRTMCAKEAAQYLYPKRRAVEVSGDADGDPIQLEYKGDLVDLIRVARGKI